MPRGKARSVPIASTALLVLRVWREEDSQVPLRAEIRMTRDISAGFERNLTVTDVDAACRVIVEWLVAIAENHTAA